MSAAAQREVITERRTLADDLTHLEQAVIRQRHVEPPLPEHARRWPQTAEVERRVRAEYDGTASSCRAIGQTLTSRAEVASGEPYPSWRIEQIAVALGLAEEKRDELLARLRAEEQERKSARMRPPELQPRETARADEAADEAAAGESERTAMTTPATRIHGGALHNWQSPAVAPAVAPAMRAARGEARERPAHCAQCGKAFTAKRYSSGWTAFCSASCGRRHTIEQQQQQRREQSRAVAPAAPSVTPVSSAQTEPLSAEQGAEQGAAQGAEQGAAQGAEATPADAPATTPLPEPSAEPPTPAQPDEAQPDAEPTAQASEQANEQTPVHAGSGVSGLLALWNLLTGQSAQPSPQPLFSPGVSPWLVAPSLGLANSAAHSLHAATEAHSDDGDDGDDADADALDDSLLPFYLDRLPTAKQGKQWTTRERARWLRAFTAALDLEIETTDETPDRREGQEA